MNLLLQMSDAELVRRAQSPQAGSRLAVEAVGNIYDRYQERIFRYLWTRTSERQLAEDLTAEVFMRMITQLQHYRTLAALPPEAAFQAWLYRIAHNLLVDHYRKESRRQELSLEQVEYLADEHSSPAQTVEQNLLFEQVQGALQQLKPEYQDVIFLRFMAGLSLQEVAQILGKTLAVVKITQHRGLEKLRAVLGPVGSEEQDERA